MRCLTAGAMRSSSRACIQAASLMLGSHHNALKMNSTCVGKSGASSAAGFSSQIGESPMISSRRFAASGADHGSGVAVSSSTAAQPSAGLSCSDTLCAPLQPPAATVGDTIVCDEKGCTRPLHQQTSPTTTTTVGGGEAAPSDAGADTTVSSTTNSADAAFTIPSFVGGPEDLIYIVRSAKIVVVNFTATWCKPCADVKGAWYAQARQLHERYNLLQKKTTSPTTAGDAVDAPPGVLFFDIDITQNEIVTGLHDVRCLPTFCCYVESGLFGTVEGAHVEKLAEMLEAADTYIKEGSSSTSSPPSSPVE